MIVIFEKSIFALELANLWIRAVSLPSDFCLSNPSCMNALSSSVICDRSIGGETDEHSLVSTSAKAQRSNFQNSYYKPISPKKCSKRRQPFFYFLAGIFSRWRIIVADYLHALH